MKTLTQIPLGAQLLFGAAAKKRRRIERTIFSVFERWNYEEIIPPIFDYYDVFTNGMGAELEKRFAARAREVDNQPGFLGFELLRPIKGETRYFVVTHWESDEAFQNWVKSAAFTRGHVQARADSTGAVAHGSAVMEFEVVELQAPATP